MSSEGEQVRRQDSAPDVAPEGELAAPGGAVQSEGALQEGDHALDQGPVDNDRELRQARHGDRGLDTEVSARHLRSRLTELLGGGARHLGAGGAPFVGVVGILPDLKAATTDESSAWPKILP